MDPIAFELGTLQIRWYGIMMALSMMVGAWIAAHLLNKRGRDGNAMWDALFYIIIFSIIGARLIYVLTNLSDYAQNPWDIFAVWQGGLSFHGGVIAGGVTAWLFFQGRGIPPLEGFDAMVPGVSIGVILVRIGNFMNGDILGYKWEGPWAMNFPYDELHGFGATRDEVILRHPTELYGLMVGVICLLVVAVLYKLTYGKPKRLPIGTAFVGCFITYSVVRGIIEDPFRDVPLLWAITPNPEELGYGLFTTSQVAAIPVILIFLALIPMLPKWEKSQLKLAEEFASHGTTTGSSRQVRRAEKRKKKSK